MAHRGLIRALALLTSLCRTARCSAALQPHATGAGHLQADLAPMQGQQPSRRLLQNAEAITAASGTLVIVSTAQQLAQAVNVDGIQHVLIVSHLNLADLPSMDALDHLALRANASTQSIQGNCTDTTPPILGRPLEPPLDTAGGQCLLIIREDGLETAGGDSALVLHNLYFARFTQDVGGGAPFSTLVVARGGALRLSQTVLSGDGSAGRGLHVEAADVVASECTFVGFRAGLGAGALVARSSAGAAGQVTLTNARFSKNVAGSSGPALYLRAGTAARLTGVSAPTGADAGTPTAGSLRPNTVVDQPPDTPAIAVDAQPSASGNLSSQANVFSAGPRVVGLANRGTAPAEALAVAPTPRVENGRFSAIREDAAVKLDSYWATACRTPGCERGVSGSDAKLETTEIVIIVLCGVLLASTIAGVIGLVRWRQRKARGLTAAMRNSGHGDAELDLRRSGTGASHDKDSPTGLHTTARGFAASGATSARLESAPSATSAPPRDPSTTYTGSASSTYEYGGARAHAAARDVASAGMSVKAIPSVGAENLTSDASTTLGATTTGAVVTLTAPRNEEEALTRALDDLRARKVPFLGKYVLGGDADRRRGGQGVDPEAAFQCERAMCERGDLRDAMPAVKDVQERGCGGAVESSKAWRWGAEGAMPCGRPFPPCIVAERGLAMDEWAAQMRPSFIKSLQVVLNLAERLQQLHSKGLVHRDLKPANALWRTSVFEWTLIDFGCAAEAGSLQLITFSPRYAPPEVAAAEAAGRSTHVVLPSLDIWALGVMAFELLAERPAFPRFTSKSAIFSSLLDTPGAPPLPWDDAAAAGDLEKLRNLRGPVLACLSRDPEARPTADALVATINELFGAAAAAPSAAVAAASGGGDWGLGGARDENTWVTRVAPGVSMGVPGGAADTRARASGGGGEGCAMLGPGNTAPLASSAEPQHQRPAGAVTWQGNAAAAQSGALDASTAWHTVGARAAHLTEAATLARTFGEQHEATAQRCAEEAVSHGEGDAESQDCAERSTGGVHEFGEGKELREQRGPQLAVDAAGSAGSEQFSTCSVASTDRSASRALSLS